MANIPPFSDSLGYISIACWIFAQIPQILENFRNQSCEGLSFPFLCNWAIGDISNLIGCILTHQLPFQTWLAGYFCVVDSSLIAQYAYYGYITKPPLLEQPPSHKFPGAPHRLSVSRGASRYRTISSLAANIAASAAFAAGQDELSDLRYAHPRSIRRSASLLHERTPIRAWEAEDEGNENEWSPMMESFHSEGGRRSRRHAVSGTEEQPSRRRGSMSMTLDRENIPRSPEFFVEPSSSQRGRSLLREDTEAQGLESRKTGSRASRKSAAMVFLAVWAIFTIGPQTDLKRPITAVGRVLNARAEIPAAPTSLYVPYPDKTTVDIPSHYEPQTPPTLYEAAGGETVSQGTLPSSRVIGRIFAWICATMYLTSRLPQIWKNFVRRSVEGLSMYLFVFAFLGNSFYVASILTSPNASAPAPKSTAFLRESLPYLLGSGGTLMFDLTILSQSLIYARKSHRHHRGQRRSTAILGPTLSEEEAGLLSGDVLDGPADPAPRSQFRQPTSPLRNRTMV